MRFTATKGGRVTNDIDVNKSAVPIVVAVRLNQNSAAAAQHVVGGSNVVVVVAFVGLAAAASAGKEVANRPRRDLALGGGHNWGRRSG